MPIILDYQGVDHYMYFECGITRSETLDYLNSQNIFVGNIIPPNNPVIEICKTSIKDYFNGDLEGPYSGIVCEVWNKKGRTCENIGIIYATECYNQDEYGLWISFFVLFTLFHIIFMFIGGFLIYYHKPHRTIYYAYLLNYEIVDLLNLNQNENKCRILVYIMIKRFFCLDLLCCPCISTYGFIDRYCNREVINPDIISNGNATTNQCEPSTIEPSRIEPLRIEPSRIELSRIELSRIERRRPSHINVISSRSELIQPNKGSEMERAIQNSRIENVRRYDNIPIAYPIGNV